MPSQAKNTGGAPRRKKRRIGRKILKVIGSIFLVLIIMTGILIAFTATYIKNVVIPKSQLVLEDYPTDLTSVIYVRDPNQEDVDDSQSSDAAESGPAQVTQVLDGVRYVQLQKLYGEENRTWVDYEQIPKALEQAAVAIEDKRFYEHNGVDWYRTVGAFFNMFLGMKDTFGGSTITQQLIKNLTNEKDATVQRKVIEIFRALELEKNYSKDTIMEWYLNYIYLGEGCYGVGSAAYTYFDKPVSELSLAECACLIGITNNPSRYDPYINEEANKNRQKLILQAMYEQEFITASQRDSALAEELVFRRSKDDEETTNVLSYYVDRVIAELIEEMMEEKGVSKAAASKLVYSGGYQIFCNLDQNIQSKVDNVYQNTSNLPYKSASGQQLQSAITVIDPYTGYVVALSGGMGEKTTSRGWSRASDSLRPPGSAIKPLSVYGPALDKGVITPYSVVNDSPFKTINGKAWPVNVDHVYGGMTTVFNAVRVSKNTVAVKVLDMITPQYSFDFLTKQLGFKGLVSLGTNNSGRTFSDIDYAPLALGGFTNGASTLEMAAGYCIFPNGGVYHKPTTYSKVLDSKGNTVLDHTTGGERVISQNTAFYMNEMLQGVVSSGTGTGARFSGMTIAGKTGTTTSKKDTWFVGYTPYYVAAVWVGYDRQERVNLSTNQAPIMWRRVMSQVHSGLPNKKFDINRGASMTTDENDENRVTVSYCMDSGKIATNACRADVRGSRAAEGSFAKGHEPTEKCDVHTYVRICTAGNGYHLAGKYCPDSTIRSVSVVKSASGSGQASFSYETLTSRGTCKVHTAQNAGTEPSESTAPSAAVTHTPSETEPTPTPAAPTPAPPEPIDTAPPPETTGVLSEDAA